MVENSLDRLADHQQSYLEKYHNFDPRPDANKIKCIASEVKLTAKAVKAWFAAKNKDSKPRKKDKKASSEIKDSKSATGPNTTFNKNLMRSLGIKQDQSNSNVSIPTPPSKNNISTPTQPSTNNISTPIYSSINNNVSVHPQYTALSSVNNTRLQIANGMQHNSHSINVANHFRGLHDNSITGSNLERENMPNESNVSQQQPYPVLNNPQPNENHNFQEPYHRNITSNLSAINFVPQNTRFENNAQVNGFHANRAAEKTSSTNPNITNSYIREEMFKNIGINPPKEEQLNHQVEPNGSKLRDINSQFQNKILGGNKILLEDQAQENPTKKEVKAEESLYHFGTSNFNTGFKPVSKVSRVEVAFHTLLSPNLSKQQLILPDLSTIKRDTNYKGSDPHLFKIARPL